MSEWQTVQQRVNGSLLLSTDSANLPRVGPDQQQAVTQLQAYRRANSPQEFSQLLEAIAATRHRYSAALSALAAQPPVQPESTPLYSRTFLNLTDSDWQSTQIEMQKALDRLLTQGIYPGLSETQLNQAIILQVKASVPVAAQPLAVQLLSTILSPNLIKDPEQTKLMAEQAAQAIEPTLITFQKGDIIVRAGKPVTQADFVLLDHFNLSQRSIDWLGLLSFGGLIAGAIGIFRLIARRTKRKLRQRDYFLILLLVLSAPIVVAVSKSFTGLPAIGLLLGSFYGSVVGATVMGLLTILLPIGTEVSWRYLIPSAAGRLLGGLMAGQWRIFR